MREADATVLAGDDAGLDGRVERLGICRVGTAADELDRRTGQSGSREEEILRAAGQFRNSAGNELLQVGRQGERFPRRGGISSREHLARDLERKERVSFRRLFDPLQRQPRWGAPEPLLDQRVQRT